MPTPQSTPDESIPPTTTPSELPLSKQPRPASSPFKKGVVVVSVPFAQPVGHTAEQNGNPITPSQWTLKFESGIKVPGPTLKRIVAAIENLQPEGTAGDEWVILEPTGPNGEFLGFFQTACCEPGVFIGEINLSFSPDGSTFGYPTPYQDILRILSFGHLHSIHVLFKSGS